MFKNLRLRHFFLAFMFGFVALWWVSLAHTRAVHRVVKKAPLPPATTPTVALAPSQAPVESQPAVDFEGLESDLGSLDALDDGRVLPLMDEMRAAIRQHPEQAQKWFRKVVAQTQKKPVEHMLFFVQAMIHSSADPVRAVQSVLATPAPTADTAYSHSDFSPSVKVNMVKVYALEELGIRLEDDPVSLEPLWEALITIAKTEPDLALAREAAQRIRQAHPEPHQVLKQILQSRQPSDRFAFQDLS